MSDFEKLGAFYLGRAYDLENQAILDDLLLYDSKDLTTHAMCVGMTGSGKTGLCVGLLEEAAIDGIPALVIDPKGDLGNLALTFPQLRPQDFEPWVDPGAASRKGMDLPAYAADRAKLWREGLASWGQDGRRIKRLKDAADVAIYTPGSDAGLPLRILRSFKAPPADIIQDGDAFRERLSGTASGLLGLVGIDADPMQSREHVFLTNLLDRYWREGRDLDLAGLIQGIQSPPFETLGIMDVESFYPAKDRFKLAMALNNLLASPSYSAWMTGEPLDIERLLYTAEGKPRIAILSIAHMSDAERMFFVTLLLNEVVSWMRSKPGTGSLRALLYMDEIFGFFPPVANPPSKRPMLTLLKQARAFGVGVVLATQNPVDLDYKGLTNCGTWFIGRLQTQRDKERLLDGLASAATATAIDSAKLDTLLSSLGSRVFLMNNVHEDGPTLFHTRWALSYLRGPMTREHIRKLTAGRQPAVVAVPAAPATRMQEATLKRAVPASPAATQPAAAGPPALPPGVQQAFLPIGRRLGPEETVRFEPAIIGVARLHYVRQAAQVDEWTTTVLSAPLDDGVDNPWSACERLEDAPELLRRWNGQGTFAPLPAIAARKTTHTRWRKKLIDHLYRDFSQTILRCKALKQYSTLGEPPAEFRVRLRHALHEKRDARVEKLRKRYGPKLATLEDRIRRAESKVEREASQANQAGLQTAVSFGATILGALFGRKKASVGTVGRAASTMRRAGRTVQQRGDVSRARESVEALAGRLADLEAEFEGEVTTVRDQATVDQLEFEDIVIAPRKGDIDVETCAVVWMPFGVGPDGVPRLACTL